MADDGKTHVLVKFSTKQKQYAVPETPYSVSTDVDRQALNQLINKLLNEDSSSETDHVQFDFLLDGEFLQTPLSEQLQSKEISSETLLDIEYVERQAAPQSEESLDHDDWVSAVQGVENVILTGSYDNTARLWSTSGDVVMTIPGHSAPVKCVAWIKYNRRDSVSSFVTGSHDQTALVWHWNRDSNEVDCRLSCRGHAASIDCVAVNPSGEKMCTGSWDKMLKLWSTICTEEEDADSDEVQAASKKKKKSSTNVQTRVPVLTLSGHNEAVSAVQWMDSQQVVTSSWDHSIRLWDLQQAQQTSLLPGTKAFLDVSYSSLCRLLVTASADRHVRVYDPRSTDSVVKCAFSSHTGWVSGVSWSPDNENLFLSGSYDTILKLWDIRSPKAPLYDMNRHEDRILAVDWSIPQLILSGGVDNKVHVFHSGAAT